MPVLPILLAILGTDEYKEPLHDIWDNNCSTPKTYLTGGMVPNGNMKDLDLIMNYPMPPPIPETCASYLNDVLEP